MLEILFVHFCYKINESYLKIDETQIPNGEMKESSDLRTLK